MGMGTANPYRRAMYLGARTWGSRRGCVAGLTQQHPHWITPTLHLSSSDLRGAARTPGGHSG